MSSEIDFAPSDFEAMRATAWSYIDAAQLLPCRYIDDRNAVDVKRAESTGAAVGVEAGPLFSQADGKRLIDINPEAGSIDALARGAPSVCSSGSGQVDRVHELGVHRPCFAEGN